MYIYVWFIRDVSISETRGRNSYPLLFSWQILLERLSELYMELMTRHILSGFLLSVLQVISNIVSRTFGEYFITSSAGQTLIKTIFNKNLTLSVNQYS